ncbi:hypothetical protein C9F11_08980 [Streptomyces sp. YIM 121038]|uniref:type II toxin-antitoxin system Phd/YefM family antitoxin n=1 Tax=Streptomyces sp. YIM 121038 TaxID=2136401 RepID=UPI001110EE72|nr:hypothetical protein [Streptomyces sp. YIM 121038]QCX75485.1 hypothetical protein C9F11_08980 [Streptomyces sp. YIM 121038]
MPTLPVSQAAKILTSVCEAEVMGQGLTVTITKNGKPIADLVPHTGTSSVSETPEKTHPTIACKSCGRPLAVSLDPEPCCSSPRFE